MKALEIKKDIYWVGALDSTLRIFDIIMYTPYGTTYNSYVVKGSEKTAIFETVKEKFFNEYLERLKSLDIDVENIDYIIVDHTEPDHAGSVAKLLDISKNAKVVGSKAAINFLKAIVNREFEYITVGDGDSINLGNKTLKFISAPFLHWPDTMYTYVQEDKLLITCDSFGSHYCNENIYNDLNPNQEDYLSALKYYFDCIMGPFKPYVLKAIDKIKDLDIDMICPGHGPVLRQDPWKIVNTYKKWSTKAEDDRKRITICYVSAYGYTEDMAKKISEGILSTYDFDISMFDVIRSDSDEIQESISKADGFLFGSPTINGDALKPILDILNTLSPIVHGGIPSAAFGSYGWSGEAVPNIEGRLKQLRLDLMTPGLKIKFKPSEDELKNCFDFGKEFGEKILKKDDKLTDNKKTKPSTKRWKCIVCGLIMEGEEAPEICPACGAGKDQFVEIIEEKVSFTSCTKENIVIIGNGAAGYYAAEAARKRNANCSIKILSSENILSYFRPTLSDLLSKNIPESELLISDNNYYSKNNIDVILNTYVLKIDSASKKIYATQGSDKKEFSYDKLILANGSSNFIPPIKGIDTKGVFTLRDLKDAENIKGYMKSCKKAVIIGGGLLGLEAAWEMKKFGLEVTVIEFANALLSKQLDKTGSEIVLNAATDAGINILLRDSAEEILGKDKVNGIKLRSGKILRCDILLFSVGIRPNITLGKSAGVSTNNGILVNSNMETSIRDIYACGDVAEFNEKTYGNWPAATYMGKVAGANAVGDSEEFKDFVSSFTFNALEIEVFSCGEMNTSLEDIQELVLNSIDSKIYKKLFFKNNILVKGILIGDTRKAVKLMNNVTERKIIHDVIGLIEN